MLNLAVLDTFLWGAFSGICITLALVWYPSWRRLKTAAQYRADVRRITGGLAGVEEHTQLDDRDGAFEQAKTAYRAIYPGRRREPDPAWVAYVEDRPAFFAADEQPDVWEPTPVAVGRHRAAETEPPPAVEAVLHPQWSLSWASYPTWGVPLTSRQVAPLRWHWWEMWLARAILASVRVARRAGGVRARLAWYRLCVLVAAVAVLSRFESSGQRVNRDGLESVDDFLEGVAAVAQVLRAGMAETVQALRGGLVEIWRALCVPFIGRTPSIRPKRHYYSPIKEG